MMMIDLATYLRAAVSAQRAETFAQSDQLSLGEIISKCEAIAERGYTTSSGESPWVQFDFEYAKPIGVDSWRGIYSELAINFDFDGDDMRLPDFIEMLKGAVGKSFTGYKGAIS